MRDGAKYDLAIYRLEKAGICLKDAVLLLQNNRFMAAANRAYYAIFHSARSVLALNGEDRKRHSGVISYFQEHYIKTGIIEKTYSYILQNAFEIRQESDYEDFYVLSKQDAEQQVANAEKFLTRIKEYICCYNDNQ
ncbi:MAG TPA: HEPN domain-containing protein [Candidatus Ornithomonoglobus merdipullorum]|uniref:HEPN domain-containing protein n=1 Tax=Candidatus Ornithomonoglobus merdipullorum TaxID=2840895 RepID=A0A9D1SFF9_9FIRM|nr:HEPN domain-containing protein [Candidatus Ornithomonoglobus merdipullorum]